MITLPCFKSSNSLPIRVKNPNSSSWFTGPHIICQYLLSGFSIFSCYPNSDVVAGPQTHQDCSSSYISLWFPPNLPYLTPSNYFTSNVTTLESLGEVVPIWYLLSLSCNRTLSLHSISFSLKNFLLYKIVVSIYNNPNETRNWRQLVQNFFELPQREK